MNGGAKNSSKGCSVIQWNTNLFVGPLSIALPPFKLSLTLILHTILLHIFVIV